jgi:hypothetical protein
MRAGGALKENSLQTLLHESVTSLAREPAWSPAINVRPQKRGPFRSR